LGFREQTIAEWRRLPAFKEYLAGLRADTRAAVVESAAGQGQPAPEGMNEIILWGAAPPRAPVALPVCGRGLPQDGAPSGSDASAIGRALVSALGEARQ